MPKGVHHILVTAGLIVYYVCINREPLPNPWAPASANNNASAANRPTSTTSPGPINTTGQNANGSGGGPAPTGMTGLMQQMMQNMGGMQNLLNTPYTQNLLESLLGNPDLAHQMMSANPLFANNPQMQGWINLYF